MNKGFDQFKKAFRKAGISSNIFKVGEVWTADDKGINPHLKKYFGWSIKESHPVLIVQNNPENYNPLSLLILVAPITSFKSKVLLTTFDLILKKSEAKLNKDSVVHLSQIFAIPKIMFRKKLGTISESNQKIIKTRLLQLFGLLPIE